MRRALVPVPEAARLQVWEGAPSQLLFPMPCIQLPPLSSLWGMVTVAAKHVLLSWGLDVLVLVLPAVPPRVTVHGLPSAHSVECPDPGHARLQEMSTHVLIDNAALYG